jgi:hypothetical protein
MTVAAGALAPNGTPGPPLRGRPSSDSTAFTAVAAVAHLLMTGSPFAAGVMSHR